jgi:hypothetical protein
MTATIPWLTESEEELSDPPARLLSTPQTTTKPGFAEIKKHNAAGLREGLAQLRFARPRYMAGRGEPADRERYLITYVPVHLTKNRTGKVIDVPDETTSATHVHVYAVRFDNARSVPTTVPELIGRTWMDLGRILIPPAIGFPRPNEPARFGSRIEGHVRRQFITCVVKHPNPRKPWNIDVVWNELAEFYSELARELGSMGGSFRF